MSIQVVSINLDAEVYDAVKNKVARNKLSKILRNYIINEYSPSKGFKDETKIQEFKVKLISLDEESLQKIDQIVKEHGKGCNRSLVVRDVLNQLLTVLESDDQERYKTSDQIVHSSYYFFEGTRDKLDQIMKPWDRSSKIEYFLKTDYDPERFVGENFKIKNAEEIKIDLDVLAHSKLTNIAKRKNTSNSEVMRDVVRQLFNNEISKNEKGFRNTLVKYDQILGKERVQEIVRDFYNSK
ncbi:hypothetical protein [Bacillus subtilis]|uniref:hypothetical protein n=1 Tax=Bacillus subtilis TaxID=1423 RepID=UPI0039FD02F9